MVQSLGVEPAPSTVEGVLLVNGRPAPGRVVRGRALYLSGDEPVPWRTTRETLTDSTGRFRLTDMRGHSVELSAASLVGPGQDLVLAKHTLARRDASLETELHASTGRLALSLSSADGSALNWAQVELTADSLESGAFASGTIWHLEVTGTGRAAIVPAGSYRVTALGADDVTGTGAVRVVPEQPTSIELRLGRR